MNLEAWLAYLFLKIFLYFGVWSIKDFDSFGDSLILLNIIILNFNECNY